MSRVVTVTDSITVLPSSYDTTDYQYRSFNNPANGYTDTTSTTYAQLNWTNGSGAASWVYFQFDTSAIPANATITSVSCKAKAYVSTQNSNYVKTRQLQLFTGTTALGSAVTVTTTATVFTLTASNVTREQASNLRVRVYAVRNTKNTTSSYATRFYGAELTVEYSYPATYYTVSASSTQSGVTVSPASAEYIQGSSASVTITGANAKTLVEDNGSDVTGSVSSGVYTIQSIAADHTILISEKEGQTIYYKVNGTWVPASAIWIKQNGTWKEGTMFIKDSGTWKS